MSFNQDLYSPRKLDASSVDMHLLDMVGVDTKKRQEELKLKSQLNLAILRLRRIGLLLLAFSLFIILNDCIGLSSAPFYLPRVKCNVLEPNTACDRLKKLAHGLYLTEMAGGFVLAAQASSVYYFVDNHGTDPRVSTVIKCFTIGCLCGFTALVGVRVLLFVLIIHWAESNIPGSQQESDFGVFLGHFTKSRDTQILATLLIMTCILMCFTLSVLSIRLVTHVDDLHSKKRHSSGVVLRPRYHHIKNSELQMGFLDRSLPSVNNPSESICAMYRQQEALYMSVQKLQPQKTAQFGDRDD